MEASAYKIPRCSPSSLNERHPERVRTEQGPQAAAICVVPPAKRAKGGTFEHTIKRLFLGPSRAQKQSRDESCRSLKERSGGLQVRREERLEL